MLLTERRARYRQILQGNVCVHPASVFDAMSARIAASLGFEVGMFAGSTASATVLGAPDIIVLTLTEFADQILRICRATTMPLMARRAARWRAITDRAPQRHVPGHRQRRGADAGGVPIARADAGDPSA
jgi:hypothetical protein